MCPHQRKVTLCQKIVINLALLPIKGHYFCFFAASAGVMPFLPIYARQLGIPAFAVGLVYTILPFLTMATKPLFAGIADHLQKFKLLLILCLVFNTLSTLCVLFIPANDHSSESDVVVGNLTCTSLTFEPVFQLDKNHNSTCVHKHISNSSLSCKGLCSSACHSNIFDLEDTANTSSLPECSVMTTEFNVSSESLALLQDNLTFPVSVSLDGRLVSSCSNLSTDVFPMNCIVSCDPNIFGCIHTRSEDKEPFHSMVYVSVQFWLFFLLNALARVSSGVCLALGDATCYEMLEGKVNNFGKQRMWGAVGWGTAALLAGWLNDIASQGSDYKNFVPGFCLFAIFMAMDIACIMQTQVKPIPQSESITKDVARLFKKLRVLVFVFSVWVIGVLTGIQWSYSFWYFQDLGATQLLMGLTLTVQCFFGELPFFFFSGWIIKKLGHFLTIVIAVLVFGIRYILYSFIYNPWLILPVELAQGPTFGSFYAAMTSFAKENAPVGTEATMQGILGATFIGFGVAIGGLLGGIGFSTIGGRMTFRYTGLNVFGLGIVLAAVAYMFKRSEERNRAERTVSGPSEANATEETGFLEHQQNQPEQSMCA